MSKKILFSPKSLSVAILSTYLAACGGGGGDDAPAVSTPLNATITGTAVKGLIQSAKVTAYKVVNGTKGDKLTETTTDTNGAYTLTVLGYSGAVILEMTADAATKMLCDIPAGCEGGIAFGAAAPVAANSLVLQTVLGELKTNNKTAITPFTHLAAKYAEKNGLNKSNIEAALTQIADLFNLPALNETTAINPSGSFTSASTTEQQYAVMNAAIAQLAGSVASLSAKLDALSLEINAKNGQLTSSGAVGLDLADVLAAAKQVVESDKFSGKIASNINTMINAYLESANKSTDVTTATPTTGAGLDDLAKAKAFVNSASLLLSTLQQYDDQSFIDTATQKVKSIQNLTDGDTLIFDALAATTGVMAEAVQQSQLTRTLTATQLNALFADAFNTRELEATASNDLKLTIDAATNTAVLNGELMLQRKKYQWNNNTGSTFVNDGSAKGFTVSNFKISYPSKTVSDTDFKVAIDSNSKIKTASVELSLASDSQSYVLAHFDSAATLQNHLDSVDSTETTHTPSKVEAKLDRVTLKVIGVPANEISQFVGNATLSGKRLNLDTTTGGKRLWPMPDVATLSGKFSSVDGDVVESTASVTLSETNPLVSPEQNVINTGFYSYQYNAANNTITIAPKKGTIAWSNATQVVLSMQSQSCINGQKRLVDNLNNWWLGNCTSNSDVAEAYKAFVDSNSNGYYWSPIRAMVDADGMYAPVYPTNFDYKSASTTLDGKLFYSEDTLSENATHQVKGTITANTKIKLVGNAAADIEALVTANYAGQQNGNLTMTLRAGDEKIDIAGTTLNGKTTVKLSNKNGVSIDVAESSSDANKLELKVNGTVQGWMYKLNGAPVVKFKDDKIKFL